ncbi:MAG: hypothetical protein MI755_18870 [Sphingomonadales bacterium]|nr:hypothetical protein [Sphingomonadales bacterium]
MVSETRSLLFTSQELIEALGAVMQQRGEGIPDVVVPEVFIDGDESGELSVRLAYGEDPDSILSFTNKELGAALVLFCMRNGIPLPYDKEKSVECRGDNVALIIRSEVIRADLASPVDIESAPLLEETA